MPRYKPLDVNQQTVIHQGCQSLKVIYLNTILDRSQNLAMAQIKHESDKIARERRLRRDNIGPLYCRMQRHIERFLLDLSNQVLIIF